VFAGGKVLDRFDLVAADKALEKSFVAFLVAVDDCLGGVDDLLELWTERAGSIDRETVNHRYLFFSEREDRLRHIIFKHLEITLADVVDGVIVSIDNADMQRHQFGVNDETITPSTTSARVISRCLKIMCRSLS